MRKIEVPLSAEYHRRMEPYVERCRRGEIRSEDFLNAIGEIQRSLKAGDTGDYETIIGKVSKIMDEIDLSLNVL